MGVGTRITVEQYQAMDARGELEPRVELIRGQIVPRFGDDSKTPMTPAHAHFTNLLAEWSYEVTSKKGVHFRVQSDVDPSPFDNRPLPDIAWIVAGDYWERHPGAADVLLIIEVADRSIRKDRGIESDVYAEAGIPDYWIADIPGRLIEVRRDPLDGRYREITTFPIGGELRPLAFPDVVLPVSRIFPGA